MLAEMSQLWSATFVLLYRFLRLIDPLIRSVWAGTGLGNVVVLRVRSRRSGRERELLLGVLRARGHLYLGHPNGPSAWTRDLDAAGAAELVFHGGDPTPVRGALLPDGAERSAVIGATNQHPFPGNLLYRLARRHILAVGRYYRLEPIAPAPLAPPVGPIVRAAPVSGSSASP
jgi:hypothetical protein